MVLKQLNHFYLLNNFYYIFLYIEKIEKKYNFKDINCNYTISLKMSTMEERALQMTHIIFVNLNWLKKILENMNYVVEFYHMSLVVVLPTQHQIQIMRVYDTKTIDSYLWYVVDNGEITKICTTNIELIDYIKQNASSTPSTPSPLTIFMNRLTNLGINYYMHETKNNTICVILSEISVAEIKFSHLGFCLMYNDDVFFAVDMEQMIEYIVEIKRFTFPFPDLSSPFDDDKYLSFV